MSGRSFRQVRTHYSNEVTTRLAHRGIEILRGWNEHVGIGGLERHPGEPADHGAGAGRLGHEPVP